MKVVKRIYSLVFQGFSAQYIIIEAVLLMEQQFYRLFFLSFKNQENIRKHFVTFVNLMVKITWNKHQDLKRKSETPVPLL